MTPIALVETLELIRETFNRLDLPHELGAAKMRIHKDSSITSMSRSLVAKMSSFALELEAYRRLGWEKGFRHYDPSEDPGAPPAAWIDEVKTEATWRDSAPSDRQMYFALFADGWKLACAVCVAEDFYSLHDDDEVDEEFQFTDAIKGWSLMLDYLPILLGSQSPEKSDSEKKFQTGDRLN